MKKILTLVVLLGFGLMVGCGEPETKPKGSGTTTTKTTSEMTKTTGAKGT